MIRNRLAVWGDPIAHSKSPALHKAAYDVLGLNWSYERRQVSEITFADTLQSLDESWLGLSLTMPLKELAKNAASTRDRHAELTGAVNTLVLGDEIAGFNTDVGGIVDALAEQEIVSVDRVRVLGAGATAASALVAAAEMGATRVDVRARRPQHAAHLIDLGEHIGVSVAISSLDATVDEVDLTVATLPSGTALAEPIAARLAERGGVLFDAAYAPWPSALATVWGSAPAIAGHGMLLRQAVRQIRVFLNGDPAAVLSDEASVVAAMKRALEHDTDIRH